MKTRYVFFQFVFLTTLLVGKFAALGCDTATVSTGPESVFCKGDQATITASIPCNSTIEPAFRILGVDWDFDSDGIIDTTTLGLSVLHTFGSSGCDAVSVTVRGTNDASFGSYCATGSTGYKVVEISGGPGVIWWFNGATGPNYPVTAQLTAIKPDCTDQIAWMFNYLDLGRVDFDSGYSASSNPALIVGSAASGPPNDVEIFLEFAGVQLAHCKVPLTVKTAKKIVCDANLTANTPILKQPGNIPTGYQSKIYYVGFDQYNVQLPLPIGFNEAFLQDPQPDVVNNWPRGPAGGAVRPPDQLLDLIAINRPIPDPPNPPLNPPVANAGNVNAPTFPFRHFPVDHWLGNLYCGSTTSGEGAFVKSTTWARRRGFGFHSQCSPAIP